MSSDSESAPPNGPRSASGVLVLRAGTVLAAVGGNLQHIDFLARVVGGWPKFLAQAEQHYEYTRCLSCSVANHIVEYLAWYGGPFYLLAGAAFLTRSKGGITAALLAVLGLAVFDAIWYRTQNSKDWYVLLSPAILFAIALAGLVALVIAARRAQ